MIGNLEVRKNVAEHIAHGRPKKSQQNDYDDAYKQDNQGIFHQPLASG